LYTSRGFASSPSLLLPPSRPPAIFIELEGLLPLQKFIYKRRFRNYKIQVLQKQGSGVVELRKKKGDEENKSKEANYCRF